MAPDPWTMSDPWSASRHVVAATCIKHNEGFGLEPHFVPKLSLAAVMLLMLVQGAAGTEVALAAGRLIENEASSGLTCLLVVQLVASHFSMIAFACLCVRLRRCRANFNEGAVFCPDCVMWLNGPTQWEDHVASKEHRKNSPEAMAKYRARRHSLRLRGLCATAQAAAQGYHLVVVPE